MHHKCGAHDRGSGTGAVKYLLGLYDSKGQLRAGVEVLRGDPKQVAHLINSLKFNCRYTSEVIAWTKEDDPTPEEIEAVLDDHERVTFAGLRKTQYTRCAVLHKEDDGSKHIHILTPRVCLESGRSLNIAPPGHKYFFAKWRNVWNYEKGWARPDDPTRARLVQPGKKSYLPADELRSRLEKPDSKDPKQMITAWLIEKIADGKIETREDLLEELSELAGDFGEITRVGKDYVSVRLSENAKPIRLKGLLYGDNFSPELIRETAAAQAARPAGREQPNPTAAAEARRELEIAVANRARYNIERYAKPARNAGESAERVERGREVFKQASERLSKAIKFRAKYIKPASVATHEVVSNVADIDNTVNLHSDDQRLDAMELVHGQPSEQPSQRNISEDSSRSTNEIKQDESRILQQSSGQEVLPNIIATSYPIIDVKDELISDLKAYPIIIATNYHSSGYFIDALTGEQNGLHQPHTGSPTAWPSYQHAPRFSSLPKLSGSHLDAIWPRASVLLPAASRGDVEQRPASSADAVRRPDSSPGAAAEKGAINDGIRAKVDEFLATINRLTHAASESVKGCIAATIAAIQSANRAVDVSTERTSAAVASVSVACAAVVKNGNGVKKYMDDELDRFKRDISIVDLAQSEFGYELIKTQSSQVYFVLQKDKQKIIVTRDKKDGHDVYFNPGDKSHSGSIIDFVKHQVDDNNIKLVRVRQLLRPWAPGAKKPAIKKPQAAPVRPVAVEKDRAAVLAAWMSMKPYAGTYLTNIRKLKPEIIKAFDVREDDHGNACFKHMKAGEGVVGYEYKNAPKPGTDKTFTGFAAGGEKALFIKRLDSEPVSRLVVVEAAIDALSYAQTKHKKGTVYISTGGTLSTAQTEQLHAILAANSKATLVIATDNDLTDKNGNKLAFEQRPGEILAKEIAAMAPDGMTIQRDTPTLKDWNADLQQAAKALEQAQAMARAQQLKESQQQYVRQR
jgi:hypothetical protein